MKTHVLSMLVLVLVALQACASAPRPALQHAAVDAFGAPPVAKPSVAPPLARTVAPHRATLRTCRSNDPRLACGRTLHHYSEFERLAQQEVYSDGTFFHRGEE
jgi:hypothetical protein